MARARRSGRSDEASQRPQLLETVGVIGIVFSADRRIATGRASTVVVASEPRLVGDRRPSSVGARPRKAHARGRRLLTPLAESVHGLRGHAE